MRSLFVLVCAVALVAVCGWLLLGPGEEPRSGDPEGTRAVPLLDREPPRQADGGVAGAPFGISAEPAAEQIAERVVADVGPGPVEEPGPVRIWRGRVLQERPGGDPRPLADLPLRLLRREAGFGGEVAVLGEVRTATDGGFAIDAPLARGQLALTVADGEPRVPVATVIHDVWQTDRNPPGLEPLEIGDRVVSAPASVKFELVERGSGRPVGAGARVGVKVDSSTVRGFGLLEDGMVVAVVDAGGFAVVGGLPLGRAEYIVHDGVHRPGWGLLELRAGERDRVERVELREGHPLRGRVSDVDGQPVAGAEVRLGSYGERHHEFGGDHVLTTAADGSFAWRDLRDGRHELRVSHERHPDLEVKLSTGVEVHEVRLSRGWPVRVRLVGAPAGVEVEGARVEFDVQESFEDAARSDVAVREIRYGRFALDAAGEFRYPMAVVGAYRVRVQLGEAGPTDWVDFAVVDGPVEVELSGAVGNRQQVRVRVVDESGAPLTGVGVVWVADRYMSGRGDPRAALERMRHSLGEAMPGRGGELTSDADGEARFPLLAERTLSVGAGSEGRCAAVVAFRRQQFAQLEEPIELVLRMAGGLGGAVHGGADDAAVYRSINVLDAAGTQVASHTCDGSGVWEVGGLLPGRYRVITSVSGRNRYDHDAAVQPDRVIGVLGSGRQEPGAVMVEVRAGEITGVDLQFPDDGAVVGRVLRGGVPFAGAEVFAVEPERETPRFGGLVGTFEIHGDHPPLGTPVSLSDPDGRFRFRVAAEATCDLWVRHRDGFVSSGPVRVVARAGVEQVVDLELGGASIRGRLDTSWFEPDEGRGPRAYVFREGDVADDAFQMTRGQLPRAAMLVDCEVDRDGAFRFDHLPAGRYVVRFAVRIVQAARQVPVVVGAGEDVDLGTIARGEQQVRLDAQVDAGLRAALPDGASHRGMLRQVFDGFAQSAFVRSVSLTGPLELQLCAGRYEIELQRFEPGAFGGGEIESERRFARFEVTADGRVEPAEPVFEPR